MKNVEAKHATLSYHQAEPGDRVRFFPDPERPDAFIEMLFSHDEEGRVEIRTIEGSIVVRPKVSNVITVENEGY